VNHTSVCVMRKNYSNYAESIRSYKICLPGCLGTLDLCTPMLSPDKCMLCFENLTISDSLMILPLLIAFGVHIFFHHHCDTSNGSQIPH